jgi:hypothetical protein
MKTVLVVIRDFGDYQRGREIDDQSEVERILASSNAVNVVARQVSVTSAFNLSDDRAEN